jgi:RND family efflux transporter MFP subunit
MKKIFALTILLMSFILLTACQEEAVQSEDSNLFYVETEIIEIKEHVQMNQYNGRIISDDMTKLSFKQGGRVNEVLIEDNSIVEKGQLIMTLEKDDVLLQKTDIQESLTLANSQFTKAKEQYDYLQDQLDKSEELYANGAIAKDQLDEIALRTRIAKEDMVIAQGNIDKSSLALQNINRSINNHELYANVSGEISQVLVRSGEMIQGGAPVALLNEKQLEVSFGVTQEDYPSLVIGDEVSVYFNDKKYNGIISSISTFPDEQSQTYEMKARLSVDDLPINAIVSIEYPIDQVKGAKIPIDVVISGDEDYVYLVEEGMSVKTSIEILAIHGNYVIVNGLESKDILVTKGMKRLKDHQPVEVVR